MAISDDGVTNEDLAASGLIVLPIIGAGQPATPGLNTGPIDFRDVVTGELSRGYPYDSSIQVGNIVDTSVPIRFWDINTQTLTYGIAVDPGVPTGNTIDLSSTQNPSTFRDVVAGTLLPSNPQHKDPSAFISHETITYYSYAGTDIVAEIVLPGMQAPVTLGELQTISYSIHRENSPVRFLGRTNVQGFLKGPRTVAGSLIFTVFNTYAFYRIKSYADVIQSSGNLLFPLADMLPPFDIVLSFSNEVGVFSKMKIFGVTITDEGGTMSVDDLQTEQVYTYMARGIQPIMRYIPEAASNGSAPPIPEQQTLRFL